MTTTTPASLRDLALRLGMAHHGGNFSAAGALLAELDARLAEIERVALAVANPCVACSITEHMRAAAAAQGVTLEDGPCTCPATPALELLTALHGELWPERCPDASEGLHLPGCYWGTREAQNAAAASWAEDD